MAYSQMVRCDFKGLIPSKAFGMMSFRKLYCSCLDVSLFACQPHLMWAHPFHPPLTVARSFHKSQCTSSILVHRHTVSLLRHFPGRPSVSVRSPSVDVWSVTGMGIAHLAQGEKEELLVQILNTSQNHVSKVEPEKPCSSTVKVFPERCFGCSSSPKSSS